MNFYSKYIIYVMNKSQIIILYHINQFTNLYNLISSLYKYILDRNIYIYIYIVLYIINSSFHVHEFVHEHIIIFELDLSNNQSKVGLELSLFTKKTNINKFFPQVKL